MKTFLQFSFATMSLGFLITGVLLSSNLLLAISLSLAFLWISYLSLQFVNTRKRMIDAASRSAGMKVTANSLMLPFSNEEGEFILKNEGDFPKVVLDGIGYFIKQMTAYPIAREAQKETDIEKQFILYVLVSRFALRFTLFLATGLAVYFILIEDKYSFLFIPIGLFVYQWLVFWQVRKSAREIRLSKHLNKDLGFLDELMRFYGASILGMKNPNPKTVVMPTGDIVVKFEEAYFHVTFAERIYLEETVERILEQQMSKNEKKRPE